MIVDSDRHETNSLLGTTQLISSYLKCELTKMLMDQRTTQPKKSGLV